MPRPMVGVLVGLLARTQTIPWMLGAAGLLAISIGAWLVIRSRRFRAEFERDVAIGLARSAVTVPVTEADLAPAPEPVQRYLRLVGVVGQPRVRNYRIRFRGRIRGGPEAAWMPFEAEQYSFVDAPTRLFLMRARMFGVPVQAWHRLRDGSATMRVRIAGVLTIVDARGPVMDRSETVTLFNDMCILAPATLLEPSIAWTPIDDRTARAEFTNGANTISATLMFDEQGLLIDFVSDDRSAASVDGKSFTPQRFSTPVRDYRQFGPVRLAGHGEARWHAASGVYTYGEFEMLEVAYDIQAR